MGSKCAYEAQSPLTGVTDSKPRHERTAPQRLLDQPDGTTRPSQSRLLFQPCLCSGLDDLVWYMVGKAGPDSGQPLLGCPTLALDELSRESRQHYRVVSQHPVGPEIGRTTIEEERGSCRLPVLRPWGPDAFRPAGRKVDAALHGFHNIESVFECLRFPSMVP
jgi:hypothetical protein